MSHELGTNYKWYRGNHDWNIQDYCIYTPSQSNKLW